MKSSDDIERRLAELERSGRLKDELLSVLSHELRAPLHAILGWSELLLARAELRPDDHRGLEAIVRNARVQAQLIDDALDLNRAVGGKLKLELRPVDLASTAAVAIEAVRPLAQAKQLELRDVVEPHPPSCDADPQRLQQILGSLLARAIKAAPLGGEVTLSVRRVADQVELAVELGGGPSKTGAVAKPDLDVGLSLVQSLVELHGGTLHSQRGAQATGFSVRLPARASDAVKPVAAAAHRGRASSQPGVSLDGIKVLVIDDDGDARELVKLILTDAHADATTAASADEGLAILRELRPDLIISDIGMSLRDGYQFMRLVRTLSTSDGGRTPALALTAFVQSEDRARALLSGYQEHISKPVEAHRLIAAVHRLTQHARDASGAKLA